MNKKKIGFIALVLIISGCAGVNGSSTSENSSEKGSISFVNPFTSSSSSTTTSSSTSKVESSSKVSSSSSKESSSVSSAEKLDYYASIDFSKTGTALMKDLETLLDATDNTSFRYSSLFEVFKYTDADPTNLKSGKILSFYSGTPSDRGSMNREHTWPNSRGGFLVEDDPHVTRPTINAENSSRGNSFYNENSSFDPGSFGNNKYRGISARIIFYAAVKAYSEGLYLVDKNDDPQLSSTNSITKKKWNPTMGKLSTLLKWNLEYDIDATETLRNETLYEDYSHCRNPFIDDRDLACKIWGDTNSETRAVCNKN